MYFTFNRRYKILDIDDDFAHLTNILPSGDVEFTFYYKIKQQDAILQESTTVNVVLFTKTSKNNTITKNSFGITNTKSLVKNVLMQMTNAKNAIKQQDEYVVVSKRSDITKKINNEILPQLRAKVPTKDIQQLQKRSLKLVQASTIKDNADVKPILTKTAYSTLFDIDTVRSSSMDENVTSVMQDMILRQGVDPSHVINLTHRSITSNDAIGGTLRPTKSLEIENSPLSKLLHHYLFQSTTTFQPNSSEQTLDTNFLQVLTTDVDEYIEIDVKLTIPRHSLKTKDNKYSNFFIKFDLINNRTGIAIDSLIKNLDISTHIQTYYTPKKPPIVKISKSSVSTRASLEIHQIDPGATAISLYKKNIYRSSFDIDDYYLIGTYDIKALEQPLFIQVDVPKTSAAIYRIVPIGAHRTMGYEFTNVVIKPQHYQPIKAISIVTNNDENGIKVEVRNIPEGIVAIEIKSKNLTTFEQSYTNVGGTIQVIDDSIREIGYLSVIDYDVKQGNIYEYVANLFYKNGTNELSGYAIQEFVKQVPGQVDTQISDFVIDDSGELDVSFTINSNIIDGNLDIVKKLLQQQDVYDLYKDNVLAERELLKKLLTHNVQRIDLTTGQRVDFGVITVNTFSDNAFRKNNSIEPLKSGHKYRYEITVLLRDAETLFETFIKEKVDSVTQKSYTYNPSKFLHPITLNKGVIVTSQGLKTRYIKDQMAYGAIGNTQTIEASFDNEPAIIIDPLAARFNKFLNIIRWKLEGSIDQIDHFIIMKDVLGVRTIIGKAHSEFLNGNCQYLHTVTRRDEGSLTYVIVPVFNTYKLGTSAITNDVVVERIS